MSIEFTKDEAAYIDKNINYVLFDWAKRMVNHVLVEAKNKNVSHIYMNTSKSIKAGGVNDDKTNYFYEKLPALMGFNKEKVSIRGGNKEDILWEFDLEKINTQNDTEDTDTKETNTNDTKETKKSKNSKKTKKAAVVKFEDIPSNRQGIFISIIGRKEFYTSEDVNRVIDILTSKKNKNEKNKLSAKFYYDWNSKTYTGDQNFKSGVTEIVVLQRLHTDLQNMINNDAILRKFWSYLLSFSGHFGNDIIGFALISKISNKVWVINEIQSDCINHYLSLRSKSLGWKGDHEKKKGVSWEVVKDMLITHNKDKWIAKIEGNEEMKEDFMKNPDLISRLPEVENIENSEFSKYFQKMEA